MSKIPTSFFSRGTKLMGLAGKLAIGEVSSRLKTWEDEKEKLKSKLALAQEIVGTLSHLKGASMKMGQLLSLDMGDYLPAEVLKVLEGLHQQSTFLPFNVIEKILKEELKEKYLDFDEIQTSPLAAASIGQVHRAKLRGKDVVIKVQYPGVAESIPSDLKLLEVMIKQVSFLHGKKVDFSPLFQEVSEVLRMEADYHYELKMHQLYFKAFSKSAYIIPEPYEDYCTQKVLTSEFIEGLSFSQWMETKPDLEVRKRLCELFLKLYLEELFEHGLVQTDPNPGNFLITEDNRMALLDFGAVKMYDRSFVEGYRRVLLAAHRSDRDELLDESIKLNFIDHRESTEVKDIFLEMMELLVAPFREATDFDFGDKTFLNRSRDLSWSLIRKCQFSPPPKDLLFLHRKLGGMFVFIKKMDIKIKLKDYWYLVEKV